ncbi:hypothetical protein Tco_1049086 [Tanacetum coccineum]
MVGSSIYTVTSVLTQRELDLFCSTYNIPAELRPKLPDRNSTIKNSPEGKIGMYTHFIEFANYRVPLSKFLLCVLEYYQISLSQLSVIGATKVSHFEIMCCALGRIPTVDASVCPLSIPWFDGTSVVKDPLPIDEVVDLPCAELLNENRTLIKMGLLDFVKAADPFKVKIGERTLAKNEVPLITETEDRVIVPSPQPMSLVDRTIQDELNVVPPVTLDSAGVNAPVAASTGGDHRSSSSGPKAWNVINNDRLASPVTCRNLLDHVTPPSYWAALRNQHDATFLDAVNVNSAQHRNAEIVDLNTRLEKSEAEVDEVIELRKRVSDLEATVAVKHDGLKNQVVGEGKMREEFALQQDAAERRFVERASELDARIADVRRDMDNDLYLNMLTAIAGYSAVHGKAGRSLAQLEAYDPEVEGKYVAAVSEFKNISFPLLDELESLKDSLFASIMSVLVLKDDQGNMDGTPEFAYFQPSLDQGKKRIVSASVDWDFRLCSPPGSSLDVADYQVLSDDGGPVVQPPIVQAHDDLFNASVLDGAGA